MLIKENNSDLLNPEIFNNFINLLEKKETKKIFNKIKNFHPSEIASYIAVLNTKHRIKFLQILSDNLKIKILSEIEPMLLKRVVNDMDFDFILKAIQELDSDKIVLVIKSLDQRKRNLVLSRLVKRQRLFVEENLNFNDDTAGSLMQNEVVSIPVKFSVGDTIDFLRKKKKIPKIFHNIYVVGEKNKLLGTVDLCSIISSSRKKKIYDLMKKDNLSVHFSVDQEEVAYIFRKRNLTSIGVINDNFELIGAINVDDIVDVIDIEAQEDIFKLAGMGNQSFYDAVISITKARFLWLFFNLIAALIACFVIKSFEGTIEKFAVLAALMPIVASMGGCSGTQSLTTAVRAIAMKQLRWSNALRSTGKEILIGIVNGLIFSTFAFVMIFLWFSDYLLSIIISISLFLNLIFGSFFGAFIPVILTKKGIDPAVASGTFVTTLTDIVGFLIFLSLATIFLI